MGMWQNEQPRETRIVDTTRASLLIRIRNRDDQAAWSQFDSIYRPMLFRFARARGMGETEAEEIAQQCMTAIQGHIGGFDYDPGKGRFKSWLSTVVHNLVNSALRHRREVQAATHDFRGLRDRGPTPEELFDNLWRQEHLRHCLRLIRSEVEESTFQVFVAFVMEEQPLEDVCEHFALTPNHVRVIKSRMTQRLRRRMVELLGTEE